MTISRKSPLDFSRPVARLGILRIFLVCGRRECHYLASRERRERHFDYLCLGSRHLIIIWGERRLWLKTKLVGGVVRERIDNPATL